MEACLEQIAPITFNIHQLLTYCDVLLKKENIFDTMNCTNIINICVTRTDEHQLNCVNSQKKQHKLDEVQYKRLN